MEKERGGVAIEGAAFDDYWQEFNSFVENGHSYEDEDEATKTPDEGEAEEEWLREAGLETLVNNESPEDQACNEILSTLTTRQREVVLKRLEALEMTKKKKKHKNRQRADVRQVFCHSDCKDEMSSLESDHRESHDGSESNHSDHPVVFRIACHKPHEDQHQKKPSSSVLPPFLRTGHSGGFSLREHSKAIDAESHTSVEVLKYESRTSVIQSNEPNVETRDRNGSEGSEISFQGISSRLTTAGEQKDHNVDDSMWRNHVPVSELSEEDRTAVRSLSVIEATALLDGYGLVPRRRRKVNPKKNKDAVVFGISLTSLLELDRRRCPGLKIPLIYQWVLHHLDGSGLKEEGLLRLAGSMQKIEALKAECEKHYVTHPLQVETCIHQSSVYDAAVLLKQLIRQLPEPLLTQSHIDTFLQVPNIPVVRDQICALNLLVLALPDVHRELLQELMHLLQKIVDHQDANRMSLGNVAMIIAPNLFPPPRLKKNQHKSNDLEAEVTVAALSSKVTQLLIKYNHLLGMVPRELLGQARLQSYNSSKKQAKRCRGRKIKSEKLSVIKEAVLSTNGHTSVIRVNFPSSPYLSVVPVTVNEHTTAAEVIQQVASVMAVLGDPRGQPYAEQQENKALFFQRPRTESEPTFVREKCLFGVTNSFDCLHGHSLYYAAENIGERKLDSSDCVLKFWKRSDTHYGCQAPSWKIRCHH